MDTRLDTAARMAISLVAPTVHMKSAHEKKKYIYCYCYCYYYFTGGGSSSSSSRSSIMQQKWRSEHNYFYNKTLFF